MSGENRRVSDTCQQGIKSGKGPRGQHSREHSRTERRWINKQMKRLLGKMVATSCLGWKESILARLFIGEVAGMVCDG